MERLCEHCGQSFMPKRTDAAYCGQSCRQQAYMARKLGLGIQNPVNLTNSLKELDEIGDKQEPSISVIDRKPSIEEENLLETEAIVEFRNDKPKQYHSSFLDYIDQRVAFRQRDSFLSAFEFCYPALSHWVNTRSLCLIESLLAVSEMKSVNLNDLKDICDAFYLFFGSKTIKNAAIDYPYMNELNKYYENIRQFCINSEDEVVMLRFTRTTKAELLAARFELIQFVSWIRFDQLNFGE